VAGPDEVLGVLARVFANGEATVDEALIDGMVDALGPFAADDLVCEMRGTDEAFVGTYPGTYASALQVGVTRHGGVELSQPSASVWKLRDGLIYRVEFHLDRGVALKSAREP